MKKNYFLLILFCFSLLSVRAQSWVWGRTSFDINFAQSDPYGDHCVRTDPSNNVYEAGDFLGNIIWGKDTLLDRNLLWGNIYLVKYDPNGNLLWVKEPAQASSASGGDASSVATDPSGNAYMTGLFTDTLSFGPYTISETDANIETVSIFLTKYDPNGNPLWAKQAVQKNNLSGGWGNSVVTDKQGDAYITGFFFDTISFGTTMLTEKKLSSLLDREVFFTKYDPNGNVLWAKQSNPTLFGGSGKGSSLALDTSGNIYMVGVFYDTLAIAPDTLISTNSFDVFLAKYDPNGNVLWATQANPIFSTTSSDARGLSVAVDGLGYPYITGYFNNKVAFGSDTLKGDVHHNNAFLAKYTPSGNLLWAKQNTPTAYHNGFIGYSLACDTLKQGGGYLICISDIHHLPLNFIFPPDTFTYSGPNSTAAVILRFDSAGNMLCGTVFTDGVEDDGNSVATDPSGQYIYMGGDGDQSDTGIFRNDSVQHIRETAYIARWKSCCILPVSVSPADSSICSGTSIALSASGSPSYSWSPATFLNTSSGPSVIATPTANITYSVTTDSLGCKGSAIITINTIPLPTLSISPPADSVCFGDSTNLSASGASSYSWAPSTGLSCNSCPNPIASPTALTTYTLSGSDNGCSSSDSLTIRVNYPPNAQISAKDSLCKGSHDTLSASGAASYLWSNGSTSSSYTTGALNADSSFSLTAYSSAGCPLTLQYSVGLIPPPVVSIAQPPLACKGSKVTLQANASGSGPFTYLWSADGRTTDTLTVIDSSATYTVKVFNRCPASKSITISPDVPIVSACCNKIIFTGDDTTLSASGANIQYYQWQPASSLSCDSCPSPIASPTATTTYTLIATDSTGCQVETLITITVELPCADFTVPNVFTPNYPGIYNENNVFFIKTASGISAWSLYVYDRWGIEMFHSSNPTQYWTGYTESGEKAPDGVYYYIIQASCQNNTYKKDGFIQLIR